MIMRKIILLSVYDAVQISAKEVFFRWLTVARKRKEYGDMKELEEEEEYDNDNYKKKMRILSIYDAVQICAKERILRWLSIGLAPW